MKTKSIILLVVAGIVVFLAATTLSYFFWFSKIYDSGSSEIPVNTNQTTNQTSTNTDSEWRVAADLSNAAFKNLEVQKTYNYNDKTIMFSSGWIKNPTTNDNQSVRLYTPTTTSKLPMVVVVPGGTNDGTDYEKSPPGQESNAVKLSAEGFVVIIYSPLGTGESEGEKNYQGFDDQDGLAAIIKAGEKLENVDVNKVGIASFSYGVTGATGVLARYADLGIKFYSDWEGPSSRMFTSVGCRPGSSKKTDAPGAFSCDDEAHWLERESVNFIKEAHVQYYWRIQQAEDHVQKTYGHTLEMMQAAVGNIPWVKLNTGEVNAQYSSEKDLQIVQNEKDFFNVYAVPHLIEMAKM